MLHGGVHVDERVQTSAGFKQLGIDTMAPLVCRGILIDVAGDRRLEPDYAITPDDLERAARAEIREGDAVLVRTGFGALWSKPDEYLDRKSTRLNSSHPSISYAVFCLKKKR